MLSAGLSAAGFNVAIASQPVQPSAIAQATSVPRTSMIDQLADTEWLLEDLAGAGVIDNVQTTLRFDGTTGISGRGACNRYRAGIRSEGGESLTVSAVAATRMACAPAVMNQETRYFEALQTAQRVTLDGENLLIFAEGNDAPLRFTRLNVTSTPAPGTGAGTGTSTSGNAGEMQTLVFFEGRRNVVRVFVLDGQTRMNVYDKQDRVTWIRGVEADVRQTREGTVYTNGYIPLLQ
ncbi:META domain-containing protein [Microcoleus sp. FACHB-1515]|uniref:META domain-containing protein n=2 Tax=Cyanophyceae TaxID=3028117 RepID=UPI001A7E2699|nr:META domain-containing protein [Microcoleus sp. FACHB-1515]